MTSVTATWNVPGGESDIENRIRPKTPGSTKSSGKGDISIGKTRASPARRSTDGKTGVRKTSGRVGSIGNGGSVTRSKS